MHRFKIAYLCEFPTLLGGERSLLLFLEHARSLEARVVCPAHGALACAIDAMEVSRINWEGTVDEGLIERLRTEGVELLHANSLSMVRQAVSLGEALELPVIVHARDIYGLSRAKRVLLDKSSAVIAVSKPVADHLKAIGVPSPKIVVIPNAVERPKRAFRGRGELRLPAAGPLVACVGQLSLRKGQDTFIGASQIVAASMPGVQFLMIGERYSTKAESVAYEDRLRQMSESGTLAGRVHWLGYRDDVPDILSCLDLVVVPSRQEPLSRVLLEALSAGIPCVATNIGGSSEILEDGRLGILTPADHVEALAAAMRTALTDSEFRSRVARDGPLSVQRRFSVAKQHAATVGLYAQFVTHEFEN